MSMVISAEEGLYYKGKFADKEKDEAHYNEVMDILGVKEFAADIKSQLDMAIILRNSLVNSPTEDDVSIEI